MASPMQPAEVLRVAAYLEAVWNGDDTAMRSLTQREPDEQPIAALTASFGALLIQTLLAAAFGLHDGMTEAEYQAAEDKMLADPAARVSHLLSDVLQTWARSADDQAAEDIARSLPAYIQAISQAGDDDVLPIIRRIRDTALRALADGT